MFLCPLNSSMLGLKKKTKDRNDEKLPNEHPVIGLQNSIGH